MRGSARPQAGKIGGARAADPWGQVAARSSSGTDHETDVQSNNPAHVPPELVSFGLLDQHQRELEWIEISVDKHRQNESYDEFELISSLSSVAAQLRSQSSPPDTAWDDGDRVYFDHGPRGCLFPVRNQGLCSSCYAFASTAYLEWLHCNRTSGRRVALSEQYLVDCGHLTGNRACQGGSVEYSANFYQDYGAELRQHYPYRAKAYHCPYERDETDLKTVGFLRFDFGKMSERSVGEFPKQIESSPLMVYVNVFVGWSEYGGGVFDGRGCRPNDLGHIMLLVGHGKEDGEEYWLVRNSHGPDWGLDGHLKLNKRAKQCHRGLRLQGLSSWGRTRDMP